MYAYRFAAALLCLAMVAGCDRPPLEPTIRSGTIEMTGPHAAEGAVLLVVDGPGFSNIKPAVTGYRVYARAESGSRVHILVTGNLVPGPLVTAEMLSNSSSSYAGEVVEVADRQDAVRASLSGYGVKVSF
jgi:hypothetical protein